MVDLRTCFVAGLLALTATVPAEAAAPPAATIAPSDTADSARRKPSPSTAIPEPGNIALFAAGVIGLLLGRRGSRSRHDGD